jgi:hypothetical protein
VDFSDNYFKNENACITPPFFPAHYGEDDEEMLRFPLWEYGKEPWCENALFPTMCQDVSDDYFPTFQCPQISINDLSQNTSYAIKFQNLASFLSK